MKKVEKELPKFEIPAPTEEQKKIFEKAWLESWITGELVIRLNKEKDGLSLLDKGRKYQHEFNKKLRDSNKG